MKIKVVTTEIIDWNNLEPILDPLFEKVIAFEDIFKRVKKLKRRLFK